MTTIRDLANEFDAQPYELVAFADDLLDGLAETDEIPADAEATIREAWAASDAIAPAPFTDYYIEIQALGADGTWPAVYTEHRESNLTSVALAEDIAQAQDAVIEGETWRVRVYLHEDKSHVAEAGPQVDGLSLGELAAAIAALAGLPPIERALSAATLADNAKSTLARIRRAAIYEATRSASWTDVAAALDVSEASVNKLIRLHRADQ